MPFRSFPEAPLSSAVRSRRSLRLIALSLALVSITLAGQTVLVRAQAATGDAAKGKVTYDKICATCHGAQAQGNKALAAPALWQQEGWYMIAQIQKFKSGARGSHAKDTQGAQMKAMVVQLKDDAAIADVVAYIKTLKGTAPAATITGGDAAAGKATYTKVCAACHGPAAKGQLALKAPALAGQADWYMVTQLTKFRTGIRGADPRDVTGAQMKGMAVSLPNDKAVTDVVTYIASLK